MWKIITSIISIIILISCASSKVDQLSVPSSKKILTEENAQIAYKSFNKYFYDKDVSLYYSSTDHENLAGNWTQAIFMEMVMDHYEKIEDQSDIDRMNNIYRAAYKKYSHFEWKVMKHANSFIYDDMLWWINALARAYHITQNEKYLTESKAGFKFVWNEAWNRKTGGIRWSWRSKGMTSSSNWPAVIAAVRLYKLTGESVYLTKAKKIYSWSKKNLFQSSTGRVADNVQPKGPPVFSDHSYDQGACVGASLMMYEATNEESYLRIAISAAHYMRDEMCGTDGILPAEKSSNRQAGIYKTIAIHWIAKLIKDGKQDQFIDWMQKNAISAWQNRDRIRNLMYTDYTVPAPDGEITSFDASSGVELQLVISPVEE
jgi:predicted alpha-1,6-mannanase (GH76 family)